MEHTIDVVNNLPISEHTKSIIDEVKKSVVTIIQAET
jgi:HrpA-like RNA helicase